MWLGGYFAIAALHVLESKTSHQESKWKAGFQLQVRTSPTPTAQILSRYSFDKWRHAANLEAIRDPTILPASIF